MVSVDNAADSSTGKGKRKRKGGEYIRCVLLPLTKKRRRREDQTAKN
jgi:hypothetical protein